MSGTQLVPTVEHCHGNTDLIVEYTATVKQWYIIIEQCSRKKSSRLPLDFRLCIYVCTNRDLWKIYSLWYLVLKYQLEV